MSLLLATSQVGVIVLLTLQITIQATPSAAYVQVWVVQSPVETRWTSLYNTFKIHETSIKISKINSI